MDRCSVCCEPVAWEICAAYDSDTEATLVMRVCFDHENHVRLSRFVTACRTEGWYVYQFAVAPTA